MAFTPPIGNKTVMVDNNNNIVYPSSFKNVITNSINIAGNNFTEVSSVITAENANANQLPTTSSIVNYEADVVEGGSSGVIPVIQKDIQLLGKFKSNSGMLHFAKGATATCNSFKNFGNVFSMCGIIQMSAKTFASIGANQCIFGGHSESNNSTIVLQKVEAASNQLYCKVLINQESPAIDYGAYFDASIITDGKPHCIVCCYNLGTIKVYVDENLVTTASTEYAGDITTDSFQIGDVNSAIDGISNVAIFNFDMSDANASYTLSDYQQGKTISGEFLLGKTLDTSDTFTGGVSNSGGLVTTVGNTGNVLFVSTIDGGTGNAYASASLDSTKKYSFDAGAEMEVSFSSIYKAGVLVSGYDKVFFGFVGNLYDCVIAELSSQNDGAMTVKAKLPNAISNKSFTIRMAQRTSDGSNVFPADYEFFEVENLKVRVNGTLLALENYTIMNGATKMIFDYSDFANDATCSGSVKGDNDNRVQRLVDFIKA